MIKYGFPDSSLYALTYFSHLKQTEKNFGLKNDCSNSLGKPILLKFCHNVAKRWKQENTENTKFGSQSLRGFNVAADSHFGTNSLGHMRVTFKESPFSTVSLAKK